MRGLNQAPATFHSGEPLMSSASERRANERYPIVRDVRYRVISRRGEPDGGAGKTVNVSRRGVLFTSEKPLPPRTRVELSISWPVQLDGKCALKLVARGWIRRCRGNDVAVEIDKYEFRIRGSESLVAEACRRSRRVLLQ